MRVLMSVRPFHVDVRDKWAALKPLEESAEVYGSWQFRDTVKSGEVLYECCDVIQAAVNLFTALCEDEGTDPQEEMDRYMKLVERNNKNRGRYE